MPGPDTRVVELRVHGVLGTTAKALTDSVAAVDVAGDGVGRVVRPADRMRRPAPGPVLQAGGRSVPRTVEGYVWGRMTSGGWAKATWALLFPFSLANVAHWMLPPVPEGNRAARMAGTVMRALLRLLSLMLTLLLVTQLAVVTVDLLATQCLSSGSSCLPAAPSWLRGSNVLRAALGLLPIALVVFGLHKVSMVEWRPNQPAPAVPAQHLSNMPAASVVADPDTPALRALHTTGALAIAAFVTLGGPAGPLSSTGAAPWVVSAVLLAVTGAGVIVLDDPTATRPGLRARRMFGPLARRVLITSGALVMVAAVVFAPPLAGPLPGSGDTVLLLGVALAAAGGVVALVLAFAAWAARPASAGLPPELRPWAGGWMAAPVLVVAGLLGAGFGAGLAFALRELLNAPEPQLPVVYRGVTLAWGVGAVLWVAGVSVAVLVLALTRRVAERSDRPAHTELGLLHADRTQDGRVAARAWWFAELEHRHVHRLVLGAAAALTVGVLVAGAVAVSRLAMPAWAAPLSAVGVAVLAALAAGLLRGVYLAARQPDIARRLGLLADLAAFWPREAHPIVPPCYALKVVPELAARAMEHLAHPGTRVVLVGHSQGSLLAVATVARLLRTLPESDRARVGLVTAGSQLQWAYARAFPAVVPYSSLAELHAELGGRWRSLCRGTDVLGGAVCTWSRQVYGGKLLGVGFRKDGAHGPLPPAARSATGALVLGGDHWLPDPRPEPADGRRWSPGVLGHRDYTADPEWDLAVGVAAGLEPEPSLPERRRRVPDGPLRGALPPTRTVLSRPAVLRPPIPSMPEPRPVKDSDDAPTH
ncbi:hypothetical protein [Longimycelium tulufanense]|nr:hypothetical protein [Longimycelium tulufanense]